ncbi:MAG: hypothetical protein H7Y18_21270 [Clostridiaceae bacterium]|nr:hypothetical protein [Clostridiaceae bacterium]
MKLIKKVMILIILAIIIQGSMLLFLDKYYFEVDAKVSVPASTKTVGKSVLIKVGEKSKDFKVSYDGMYLSFFDGNQLNVVNTVLGTIQKIKIEENSTISFYKWLSDNNKIVYAQKVQSKKGEITKFFYYDVKNNNSEEVRGENTNGSIVIEDSSPNLRVSDILLSTISNVMYAKLTSTSGQSLIYKSENMNSMKKTQIPMSLLGNIQLTPGDGMLYYEDISAKKIKNILGNPIDIPKVENPIILGTDSANNIYIGNVINSKISQLYWGILKGNSSSFTTKELKSPTYMKNIYITLQGKIYINDGLKGVVTELNSDMETSYTGVFKSIYDKGIISIDEEKVVKTLFKGA